MAQSQIIAVVPPTLGVTTGAKQLTTDSITKHTASADGKGPYTYWQLDHPNRTLQLGSAVRYVNQNHSGLSGVSRFVYFPDYRVAGYADLIAQKFAAAGVTQINVTGLGSGQQRTVQTTAENVYANSYDPLNPQHAAALDSIPKGTAPKSQAKYSLQQYINIGTKIKSLKLDCLPVGTSGASGVAVRRGGRSPDANLATLVAIFDNDMDALLRSPGMDVADVRDVTSFNAQKVTGALKKKPPKGARATAIRPMVGIQGRDISVPIIAQPRGASNLEAFVNTVVKRSRYANAAGPILDSFNKQMVRQQQTKIAKATTSPTQRGRPPTVQTSMVMPQTVSYSPIFTQMQQPVTTTTTQMRQPVLSPVRTTTALPSLGGLPQIGGQQTVVSPVSPNSPRGGPVLLPQSPNTLPTVQTLPTLPTFGLNR